MSGLNHRLGVPVLGSCAEETSPVGCLENQCDRKAGAPRLRLGGVWVLACHQTGQKGLPEWLPPHCAPKAALSKHPRPTHSTPQIGTGSREAKSWQKT